MRSIAQCQLAVHLIFIGSISPQEQEGCVCPISRWLPTQWWAEEGLC